jgi:coenzyme PQQ synthesis protein D (PqqD)
MSVEFMRSQRVDISRVGERAVLYHRDSRTALVLNPSGSWLWEQLATLRSRDQLAAALRAKYNLSPEKADRDIDQFLNDLRQHHAIEES